MAFEMFAIDDELADAVSRQALSLDMSAAGLEQDSVGGFDRLGIVEPHTIQAFSDNVGVGHRSGNVTHNNASQVFRELWSVASIRNPKGTIMCDLSIRTAIWRFC